MLRERTGKTWRKHETQSVFSAALQARLMNESLGREVQSRRAAQVELGKRERDVERLHREVAAYKVPQKSCTQWGLGKGK